MERGSITQEQASNHPRKNVLMRAVGVMPEVQIDTGRFLLERNDRLLLCTDGLTNMLEDEEILQILQMEGNCAQVLIQKALEAGGVDNISAIVVVDRDVE